MMVLVKPPVNQKGSPPVQAIVIVKKTNIVVLIIFVKTSVNLVLVKAKVIHVGSEAKQCGVITHVMKTIIKSVSLSYAFSGG